jgi:tape measure domain-containing protein
MADVIDAIVSQLEVRLDNYRRGYLEAIDLVGKLDKAERDADASRKRRSSADTGTTGRKRAVQEEAAAEEQGAQRVTRARKTRTDAAQASDAAETASARRKASSVVTAAQDEAKAVADAEKGKRAAVAETRRALEADATRARAGRGTDAAGSAIAAGGPVVKAGEASAIPAHSQATRDQLNASMRAAGLSSTEVREVNAALIQRVELQERLKVATGEEAVAIRSELTALNLSAVYERAGLEAKEAALRLDRELVVIEDQRARRAGERAARGADTADIYDLRARKAVATKEESASLADQIDLIQRRNVYLRAGYTEEQAAARVATERAAIERRRVGIAAEQQAAIERQMRAQQGAIAGRISGGGAAVGAIVGGLGVAEISHLNDEYIKLQNTLRVAGVDAASFATVQQHLLTIANRSGTDVNALADVYRGVALASHDLGASQADILKVTDAAANALRLTGRSSTEAQGALLQLSHAFESGRVTAREFNGLALNLYPILQAVAHGSDQWGGSVAKLRESLVNGTVTSKEFFQALLRGSDDLEKRASKASLTTAQGFNALRNALVVYFGEADKAQGVSAALGAALQRLAANLDTVIPAIAAIGTALTVGYISRLTAAAVATRGLGGAILGAFGGPVGLAITTLTLAIGGLVVESNKLHRAGAEVDEAFAAMQDRLQATSGAAVAAGGGVKGVGTDALGAIPHVNNFAGAVGNLAQQLYNQARAARAARVEMLQQQLTTSQAKERELGDSTATGARGRLAEGAEALSHGNFARSAASLRDYAYNRIGNLVTGGQQDRDTSRQYGEAVALSRDLQRQIAQAKAAPITASDIPGGAPGTDNPNQARMDKLQHEIDDLKKIEGGTSGKRRAYIDRQIERRQQQIDALAKGASPGAATAGAYVPGAGGRRGKSAETLENEQTERERRFSDQLAQIHDRYLSAQHQLTIGTDAQLKDQEDAIRSDAAKREADYRYQEKLGQLDKGAAAELVRQSQAATAEELKVTALRRQVSAYDAVTASIEQEAQLRDELLQTQAGFARNSKERLALDLKRIDNEREDTRNRAIRTIFSPDPNVTDQQRQDAGTALRTADEVADAKRRAAMHDDQGPWASYVDKLPKTAADIRDQFEQAATAGVDNLNSSLDRSLSKMLHLHGAAGQFLDDLIKIGLQAAEGQLLGGAASGGGIFGSIIGAVGGLFGGGRASAASLGLPGVSNVLSLAGGAPDLSGALTLPKLAGGGSFEIGGNGGIDRNLLSLNGRGVAMVNRGETIAVVPQSIGSANGKVTSAGRPMTLHQTINVDGRNSVTPDDFARQIISISADHANKVAAKAGAGAVQASPARVQQRQTLGS